MAAIYELAGASELGGSGSGLASCQPPVRPDRDWPSPVTSAPPFRGKAPLGCCNQPADARYGQAQFGRHPGHGDAASPAGRAQGFAQCPP
jgi:hypothetical protein